ncbi:MAG: tRNA 2-thiouridine(34) synthase MnmA [Acidobacteriota bacterium]
MKRVLVAMSGGVDSSTAAAILKKEGYDVIGVSYRIGNFYNRDESKRRCCNALDVSDANLVANKLKISHYVLDFETEFKEYIIEKFVSDYLNGYTPNPCILCNQYIKFEFLLDKLSVFDADFLATGHYAQLKKERDHLFIYKGADTEKDQSYVLFPIKKKTLNKIIFPLGTLKKNEVREIARENGLSVYKKNESQEICFVDRNYKDFVKNYSRAEEKKGLIVHVNGKILGEHNGIFNFTIGQRKGLGISYGKPLYVVSLDEHKNTVIVGEGEDLLKDNIYVENINIFVEPEYFKRERLFEVKIRYKHQGEMAYVEMDSENKMKITFIKKVRAPTPGQAAVIYEGNKLIGGGWISKD